MLKADFHSHTNYLQPNEGKMSPKELIDTMKTMGYNVLAVTEHYDKNSKWKIYKKDPLKTYDDFKDYAKEKGMLLIPGVEIQLKDGEVLLVNFKGNPADINSVKDLDRLPKETLLVAPHPFYVLAKQCIGSVLEENIDKFDAIEHCYFYTKHINRNKKAIELAKKYNKPLIANSDVHRKVQLNRNYTLVDAEKNIKSVLDSVRNNKIEIVTEPLSTPLFLKLAAATTKAGITKLFRHNF